jgi:hypothetical protein
LGQAAQARIWRQFGWDERVAKLESVYAFRASCKRGKGR